MELDFRPTSGVNLYFTSEVSQNFATKNVRVLLPFNSLKKGMNCIVIHPAEDGSTTNKTLTSTGGDSLANAISGLRIESNNWEGHRVKLHGLYNGGKSRPMVIFNWDDGDASHWTIFNMLGIEDLHLASMAAGAVLHYLTQTKLDSLKHVTSVSRIDENKYVWLDKFTIRNLELVTSPHEKAKTLIQVRDKTLSPMGARMLRRWVQLPLKDLKPIEERLEAVHYFINNNDFSQLLSQYLRQVGDLERILSKIAVKRIAPREITQLKRALEVIAPLKEKCFDTGNHVLMLLAEQLNPCHPTAMC